MLCVTIAFCCVWCCVFYPYKRSSVFCQNISECALLSSALSPKISAITGDPWWSFGAPKGRNGEGRNLCRSCIWCLTRSGWWWGIQEILVHVLVNYGLLSKISGRGSRGGGRFVYLRWVRHWSSPDWKIAINFGPFHKQGCTWADNVTWALDLTSERKMSLLSEWRQVEMLFKIFMGLWWLLDTYGKNMANKGVAGGRNTSEIQHATPS